MSPMQVLVASDARLAGISRMQMAYRREKPLSEPPWILRIESKQSSLQVITHVYSRFPLASNEHTVTTVTREATLAQLGLIIQGPAQLWVLWLTIILTRYKLYKGLQNANLIS